MQLFRNTDIKCSTICFLRLFSDFLAKVKVIINSLMEFSFYISGIFGIEVYQVINPKDFTVNNLILWVIRRLCVIPFVTQNTVSHRKILLYYILKAYVHILLGNMPLRLQESHHFPDGSTYHLITGMWFM
nr:MAG TPA: hypothetical protein [Caudoviricetes sp.]DAM51019.1 MAG TPA: hypothetical protein [Caudoviricetes sp.]